MFHNESAHLHHSNISDPAPLEAGSLCRPRKPRVASISLYHQEWPRTSAWMLGSLVYSAWVLGSLAYDTIMHSFCCAMHWAQGFPSMHARQAGFRWAPSPVPPVTFSCVHPGTKRKHLTLYSKLVSSKLKWESQCVQLTWRFTTVNQPSHIFWTSEGTGHMTHTRPHHKTFEQADQKERTTALPLWHGSYDLAADHTWRDAYMGSTTGSQH